MEGKTKQNKMKMEQKKSTKQTNKKQNKTKQKCSFVMETNQTVIFFLAL